MSYILIDFDGTCVTHAFPKVGDNIGAEKVLKKLTNKGHKLILYTSRANYDEGCVPGFTGLKPGSYLDDAVRWFKTNNIPLYGVQGHPTQDPSIKNKPFADLIIDDVAIGCPLKDDSDISPRPYVDWDVVEMYLKAMKYL